MDAILESQYAKYIAIGAIVLGVYLLRKLKGKK